MAKEKMIQMMKMKEMSLELILRLSNLNSCPLKKFLMFLENKKMFQMLQMNL